MSSVSKIEWTDASWSPIRALNPANGKIGWHCEHATTGCEFCYAEGMNKRLGTGLPFKPGHRKDIRIFLDEQMLTAPLRWKRPRRVFVCSMTDLFADFVKDEWIDKIFAVMALCPQHTFQVLTKRAARMLAYMTAPDLIERLARSVIMQESGRCDAVEHVVQWRIDPASFESGAEARVCDGQSATLRPWPLPNCWLGVSAERQQEADERREPLRVLAEQGWTTFCSYEPALGPIDWAGWKFLRWLISGGESGPNARASHPDWHRASRDWCETHGIAYFFKQWGEWAPSTPDHAAGNPRSGWKSIRAHPCVAKARELYPEAGAAFIERVGKKAAGRLLDGVEHSAFPEARQ